MNKKAIIIYIGVGCLLAMLTVWSYLSTQRRMLEVAERTFVEAVHQDLDERWKKLEKTYSFHFGKEKEVYTNFNIKKEGVEQNYSLKGLDYEQNMDSDINRRMYHTISSDMTLACHPDTLVSIWQSLLSTEGIRTSGNVAVAGSGRDVRMLRDSLSIGVSFKSLPTCYAGIANEIQLNGFVRLSIFDVLYYCPLLWFYVCLLIAYFFFTVWKIKSIVNIPVVQEKGNFHLAKDVVYCSEARCFVKGREKIVLTPKGNLIIKALLEAENHQLHGADLLAKVWGANESSMNKLYIQNTKLRDALKKLGGGFDIVNIDKSSFQFIYPYLHRNLQMSENQQSKEKESFGKDV